MKTQKIKLFKPWHKALIAGIWVGMTAWVFANVFNGDLTLQRVLGTLAISAGFAAFATAFPYLFLHNYLARKAGIPMTAGGAGWDDDHDGFHYWYGDLCYGEGHTPCFRDDRD